MKCEMTAQKLWEWPGQIRSFDPIPVGFPGSLTLPYISPLYVFATPTPYTRGCCPGVLRFMLGFHVHDTFSTPTPSRPAGATPHKPVLAARHDQGQLAGSTRRTGSPFAVIGLGRLLGYRCVRCHRDGPGSLTHTEESHPAKHLHLDTWPCRGGYIAPAGKLGSVREPDWGVFARAKASQLRSALRAPVFASVRGGAYIFDPKILTPNYLSEALNSGQLKSYIPRPKIPRNVHAASHALLKRWLPNALLV